MTSYKCGHCGLVNTAWDRACRRCGYILAPSPGKPREAAKRSPLIYLLFAATLIVGAVYYVYNGFEKSFNNVQARETNRLAAQPVQSPLPLSRSEYDKSRAEPYQKAVANSPGLATSQKHTDEINKLMDPPKQPAK